MPPTETEPPSEGALFDYLVDRLFDSFGLPLGPARYLELMSPVLPDGESVWSRLGSRRTSSVAHDPAGMAGDPRRDRRRAPAAMGLIRVISSNPFELKRNHQVLAYGYDLVGTALTLHLYDPNRPRTITCRSRSASRTRGRGPTSSSSRPGPRSTPSSASRTRGPAALARAESLSAAVARTPGAGGHPNSPSSRAGRVVTMSWPRRTATAARRTDVATTPTRRTTRDTAPKFVWDDSVEDLYASWHRRVAAAEHGHRLMADRLRRRYLLLGIPVVVLTTLVGTSAFASISKAQGNSIQGLEIDPDMVLARSRRDQRVGGGALSLQTFLATRPARSRASRPCVRRCAATWRRRFAPAPGAGSAVATSTAPGSGWTGTRRNRRRSASANG